MQAIISELRERCNNMPSNAVDTVYTTTKGMSSQDDRKACIARSIEEAILKFYNTGFLDDWCYEKFLAHSIHPLNVYELYIIDYLEVDLGRSWHTLSPEEQNSYDLDKCSQSKTCDHFGAFMSRKMDILPIITGNESSVSDFQGDLSTSITQKRYAEWTDLINRILPKVFKTFTTCTGDKNEISEDTTEDLAENGYMNLENVVDIEGVSHDWVKIFISRTDNDYVLKIYNGDTSDLLTVQRVKCSSV